MKINPAKGKGSFPNLEVTTLEKGRLSVLDGPTIMAITALALFMAGIWLL